MRNYKLDTTLLPEVWVTWASANGTVYMNPNGTRSYTPEYWMRTGCNRQNINATPEGCNYYTHNKNMMWVKSGTKLYYGYVKYHRDIDRIELAAVKYDTTRKEAKHEWSFVSERYFIGRDKSIVNIDGQPCTVFREARHNYILHNAKDMVSSILRMNSNEKLLNEFKRFIGGNHFIIGNGTAVEIQYTWNIQKWFESSQRHRTTGKTQKFVDELVSMPLNSIDGFGEKYPVLVRNNGYRDVSAKHIVYFEKINDKWNVLRALMRGDDGNLDEIWRVYFDNKTAVRITSKSNNQWVPASQQKSWHFNDDFYFANPDEAIKTCNRIKYTLSALKDDDGPEELITALRFPEVEQLYKLGCDRFAKRVVEAGSPKSCLKDIFGDYYNEKEKTILRRIGMTKHQLDKYHELENSENRWWGRSDVIKKMREMFGDDLSHIDNETYDVHIEALWEILSSFWAKRYIREADVDEEKFWKNVVRLHRKNRASARLINDTFELYQRVSTNNRPIVDWLFDSYSDVVRTHDALNEIVARQDAERNAYYAMSQAERLRKDEENRRKVDEKRKHYEFEDDGFVIRLPYNLNEIVNEGTRQRICIGGYTTRHSKGDTNIFFLRRKDADATPFYAIEMNNNSIIQIHGFCNKWLGNNPEAIPTVVRWLRKHGIECDNKILTCKATGYGRINDYIEMPIVD